MPRKRHHPEEIIAKLRQVDVLISQGGSVAAASSMIARFSSRLLRRRRTYSSSRSTDQPPALLPASVPDQLSAKLGGTTVSDKAAVTGRIPSFQGSDHNLYAKRPQKWLVAHASIATMLGINEPNNCSSLNHEIVRLYRTAPPRSVAQTWKLRFARSIARM